jgi:signal transduction histidine kinase
MDVNTCFETTSASHTIAYYSHLVPIALGLFMAFFALDRSKFSRLSVAFFFFVAAFSLWLIGDLFPWTSQDYNLVYFTWSWLDFINIVFFVLGAYFFGILARGRISLWEKLALVALCLPPFWWTITGQSLVELNQAVCEATEFDLLTNYKLFAEWVSVAFIGFSAFLGFKNGTPKDRIRNGVVLVALLAFFGVFSLTEHIASVTDVYEINLYGLFVLPLFLIVMVFSMTNLGVFDLRLLGTQVLAYGLIILSGSQFLFLQDSTESTLSLVSLIVSIIFGFLLLQNARKEEQVRIKIERLARELEAANDQLKELDQLKSEFLSIASHQLRAPITAIRGYASNIMDGTYGKVPANLQDPLETMQESSRLMANAIEDYLNISRIEQKRMKYEKSQFDLKNLVGKVVNELQPVAKKRKLTLSGNGGEEPITITADLGKIKQIISNLVDNAIKYTEKGSITVTTHAKGGKAYVEIKDTGVGIAPEEISNLFEKFKRARGANKVNTTGTGLGLYVARQLAEGHGGTIRVASEGIGKGSTFTIELPL